MATLETFCDQCPVSDSVGPSSVILCVLYYCVLGYGELDLCLCDLCVCVCVWGGREREQER